MRAVLLAALVAVAAAAAASVPAWTEAVEKEYEQVLAEAREQRWERHQGAQPGDAELRLATLSAALLTRLKSLPASWEVTQRRLQLQRNAAMMNLGKVELDGILSVSGDLRQEKVYDALNEYMSVLKGMAGAMGLDSASDLWWSPFATGAGDARSTLQTMWTRSSPLVQDLLKHLGTLPAPAGRTITDLVYECAARDECSELVKLALPYPDVANVMSDLLREKELTTEQLARLAQQFLGLLGLPAAPAEFWTSSEFKALTDDCVTYVDGQRVRLCANTDAEGLRSALSLMTTAEYLRTAAASQKAPFQTAAFPGFERAISDCVSLLALQPSVIQQLLYGYRSEANEEARLAVVSLYLAQGARSTAPDHRCSGDIGCQQAANALMEAAVTQLLPLAYHSASLRWLEGLQSGTPTSVAAAAAWRSELTAALGAPAAAATPASLDRRFYDADHHIARVLSGVASFQLHDAACPEGGDHCLPDGAKAAGALISRVMAAGSSQPWDQLMHDTTELGPSVEPMLSFFGPLRRLTSEPLKQLRTLELEDDLAQKVAQLPSLAKPSLPKLQAQPFCGNIKDEDKTAQEMAVCDWNVLYDSVKSNVTDAEWALGLDFNTTENVDDVVITKWNFLLRRNEARSVLGEEADPNKWIKDPTNADEANLWGEMFILSEKDKGAATPETLQKLLQNTVGMLKAYVDVAVCPYDKQSCDEDEKMTIWELRAAMASGDLEEKAVQYYWRQYRSVAKTDLSTLFNDYISQGRDAAKQAGLDHYGQFWLEPYGYGSKNETLLTELAATWKGLDELYRRLHTVVRHQLYVAKISTATGKQPLPSHLLGDMYAADWRNIYDDTKLITNYTIDITPKLIDNTYDIVKIQTDAIDYLKALGLGDLLAANCFGESSWVELTKGQDRDALAWTSGVDDCIKIRVTPEVTMDNYERVFAKSAELAYYLEYRMLDAEYRAPANPAMTAAVAGAVSLSALSPDFLNSKGLLPMPMTDIDAWYDVDFLYRRALQFLAPLPFNYVANKWMWELFANSLDRWEHRWWELREEIQGVRPSESRSDGDRDMLAVPEIARDQPAFQAYMATILQFQLFEKACVDAKEFNVTDPTAKPLHRCDLSKISPTSLKALMGVGNTQRWRTLLETYTVDGTLSSDSMSRYFAPLNAYLQTVITANKLETTWESNLADYWDEDVDNTVPIVVGVVLGVLVLIVVIAYFVSRVRRNKDE